MAENLSVKKSPIECVLECPLCLHQLKHPQTLQQCLHSYCKSCLDSVPQKTQDGQQGRLCPMCENFTKCDEIQQNSFIEELQKVHTDPDVCKQIKCEQCLDDCGGATCKCAECKIGLCENGKAVHLKIPMLKGHHILPLESNGEIVIDNIVFCKMHDELPAQLNCLNCDQLICSTCNTTEHQCHAVETVDQALERILPEIESSIREVDENIGIIEAQIEGVKNEIEQTKECYAACRMQMDDHLEKVISRMRAMKAQMEEDVNEQESIALNTLKELQKQLEKQLSESRIISNLTAVVTTKTRHTSQLHQLQTGLFKKVKSAAEVKNERISFDLPSTNFIESQRLQEHIENVFGKLSIKKQFVSITGDSYTKPNQLLCSDFNKIDATQYMKDKEMVVDTDWCNRLSYIDNNIWLPLDSRKAINIYNEDGELKNVIDTGGKYITVVKIAHNGDVICGGQSGLFVTDKQFSKWPKLSKEKLSDIVVDKDNFITLQYDSPSVHTYGLKVENKGQEWSWYQSHSFMLTEDVKLNDNSTICIVEQYLLISSSSAQALFILTFEGEHLYSCKDVCFIPRICGRDTTKQVLVADYGTGTMYLFKPLTEKEIQRTAILSDVQTPATRSVVIDQNNNLWVLAGNGNYRLIKFTSKE